MASLNNDSDDENQNGTADDLDDFTEMEVDDAPIPASAKKRGRPSLSASRTSTPAKTPKSAKGGPTSAASTGRKRKTLDSAAEPPTKRPGRATAAAAQDAIKEVSKKRHRAPNGSAKPKPVRLCLWFLPSMILIFDADVSQLQHRPRRPVASLVASPRPRSRPRTRTRARARSLMWSMR